MGEGRWRAPSPEAWGLLPPPSVFLILFIPICVKTLAVEGKGFAWPGLEECPQCGGYRPWGHGYVPAYFDGFSGPLYLKRYRCPDCRLVVRMRPKGYWRRFLASIATIRQSLFDRLRTGRWPPGGNPGRGRHWLLGLRRQVEAHLGREWMSRLPEGFDELHRRGLCAVSRSI